VLRSTLRPNQIGFSHSLDPKRLSSANLFCTAKVLLFDHFVGAQQDRLRHRRTKRLGGLDVDSHLEFDRQLNGKVRRLCPAQDAIDIGCRAAKDVEF
jgi:hypothetical protein